MTDDFPGKQAMIVELKRFAATNGDLLPDEYGHPNYQASRGETTLALGFAQWLEDPKIPDKSSGLNWFADLPELLDEAYADFRTLDKWKEIRSLHSVEVEDRYDIPSLVNIHEGELYHTLTAHSVVRLMPLLYREVMQKFYKDGKKFEDYEWLGRRLEGYFGAQWGVIEHSWKRFVRTCYRPFMRRYKKESHTGNHGVFGKTTLMTFGSAGRLLFTFRRGKSDSDRQITYVADDSDDYGHRAGPNSTRTPYQECVSMIDEVVDHWDLEKMKRDSGVWFG